MFFVIKTTTYKQKFFALVIRKKIVVEYIEYEKSMSISSKDFSGGGEG